MGVKRSYTLAFALVLILAASPAGAGSQAGSQHRWQECPNGVATPGYETALCTTEDGGKTWRPIFYGGNYIFSAVRTTLDTGIVSTGAYGHGEWWTRDNGRHWYPTSVIGEPELESYAGPLPVISGSDDRLYWATSAVGSTIYRVEGWPPSGDVTCAGPWVDGLKGNQQSGQWSPRRNICFGPAVDAGMRSVPVLRVDGATLWSSPRPLPTGVAAVFMGKGNGGLTVALRDEEEIRTYELPGPEGDAGRLRSTEFSVSWPRLTARVLWAKEPFPPRAGESLQVEHRSTDGGRTFSADTWPGWQWRRDLPIARSAAAAAVRHGEIVLVGGRAGFFSKGRMALGSGRVEAFNPRTGRWRRLPTLPLPLTYPAAASAGERVYVVGGFDRRGTPLRRAFVLERGRWRALPHPPAARAAGGGVVLSQKLYVVGGRSASGLARNVLVFDLRTRRWSTALGPRPRAYLGVAAVRGRILAVGGRTHGLSSPTDLVESFEPSSRKWLSLAPAPVAASEVGAATLGERLVMIGGLTGDTTWASDSVYAFDVTTGNWTRMPDLPSATRGLAAAAVGGRLYALGGDGGVYDGLVANNYNQFFDERDLR